MSSRLDTALSSGQLELPEQTVLIRPPIGAALPEQLSKAPVMTTSAVETAYWAALGHPVGAQLPNTAQAAVMFMPKSKTLAKATLADLKGLQLVAVDGAKTLGIDSLYKACRPLVDTDTLTKAHGRLFWFAPGQAFADWAAAPQNAAEGFVTQPGVFSEGKVDAGSRALAEALPATLPRRMADFGAGWGYLSAQVLARPGVESLDLIEDEALSLQCAKTNVTDPRAAFHWADATAWTGGPYDGVIMNPPFHQGKDANINLGRAFIQSAARSMAPRGTLWMVANRHLPYEETLGACFGRCDLLATSGGFKVFMATRPKR